MWLYPKSKPNLKITAAWILVVIIIKIFFLFFNSLIKVCLILKINKLKKNQKQVITKICPVLKRKVIHSVCDYYSGIIYKPNTFAKLFWLLQRQRNNRHWKYSLLMLYSLTEVLSTFLMMSHVCVAKFWLILINNTSINIMKLLVILFLI